MRSFPLYSLLAAALASLALAACSPQFNWRDYSSETAPYRVMFPDKPSTHTRKIDLDGMTVEMTMTAAQVNGAMFAVGSAQAPDAARAEKALAAMKTALVNNIGATITTEKAGKTAIDIDATGKQKGEPMRLVGHFEARGTRFYQVIVMGREKELTRENVDMFMSSFKLD